MITRANSYRFVNKQPAHNLMYEYQICLEVFFLFFFFHLFLSLQQNKYNCLCVTVILKKYLLFVDGKIKIKKATLLFQYYDNKVSKESVLLALLAK